MAGVSAGVFGAFSLSYPSGSLALDPDLWLLVAGFLWREAPSVGVQGACPRDF